MISNVYLPEAANFPCYLVLFLVRLLQGALTVTMIEDE
jgi:hypothetical protein